MKHIIIILLATMFFLIGSCELFLGPDPDNTPRGIFDRLWTDFDETYALMDIKGVDWDSVYQTFSPEITSSMSDQELFNVCANMLKTLNDAHVNLVSPFDWANSADRNDAETMDPFSLDVIKNYLYEGGKNGGDRMFHYGTFASNRRVGYIHIATFANGDVGMALAQDWVKDIDKITASLKDTDALILDLRGNRGGLQSNVDYIAGRFASEKKEYIELRTKDGPGRNDFSSSLTESVKPAGTRYTKPIILLTNKQTISGGEMFTLALLTQNHVTHSGGTTTGAFSLSLDRRLINGWRYTISVQKVTDMNGICYEEIGITPPAEHIKVNTDDEIAAGIDAQLEYAVSLCD